jgi:hypothetical protein
MKTKQRVTLAAFTLVSLLVLGGFSALCSSRALAAPPPKLEFDPNPTANGVDLTWDASAKGFWLLSSPTVGPGAVWSLVSGAPNPILSSGRATVTLTGEEKIFQLVGPQRVNVAELQVADRIAPTNLTVVLRPESDLVEISNSVTFVAIVGGYTNDPSSLTYDWQWNKFPYSTNTGSTNLTWRDLHIEQDTNFVTVPGSPTNSNFFTIPTVTTNEVAYYRVTVNLPKEGTNVVTATSLAAPLWVWQQTNSIIVYGTPVSQSGGSVGCVSSYQKRIDFGNGYWPVQSASPYSARDLQSGSSTVYYYDWYGHAGFGCGSVTVSPAYPTLPYYFTIYTGSSSPPNPYLIYLTNFH